jgi:hypothetical protein
MWLGAPSRRIRQHAAAIAVLALFAGGRLAAVAHELLVEHRRCAEHGELVDAAPLTTLQPESPAAARAAVTPGEAVPSEHDSHEHCDIVLVHRAPALVGTSTPTYAKIHAASAPNAAPEKHDAGIARHRLAPKTSPPETGHS